MILRARHAALLAIPLSFLLSSPSFAQETTGTKRDVQKRLKAAQKPQGAAPARNETRETKKCGPGQTRRLTGTAGGA